MSPNILFCLGPQKDQDRACMLSTNLLNYLCFILLFYTKAYFGITSGQCSIISRFNGSHVSLCNLLVANILHAKLIHVHAHPPLFSLLSLLFHKILIFNLRITTILLNSKPIFFFSYCY